MYPQTKCPFSGDGFHLMTVEGTTRSMTWWRCRVCNGRWERGMGAFAGIPLNEPPTLEQRVAAIEATLKAALEGM